MTDSCNIHEFRAGTDFSLFPKLYIMEVTSPAFEDGALMPEKYTCLGENVNPPLMIKDVPSTAKSLVLIFEDNDSSPLWTHWMLFNIPAGTREISENNIPKGSTEGLANNHSFGYEGPCPRYFDGIHHYRFKLYALNSLLDLPAATEREQVEAQMKDKIIDEAFITCLSTKP